MGTAGPRGSSGGGQGEVNRHLKESGDQIRGTVLEESGSYIVGMPKEVREAWSGGGEAWSGGGECGQEVGEMWSGGGGEWPGARGAGSLEEGRKGASAHESFMLRKLIIEKTFPSKPLGPKPYPLTRIYLKGHISYLKSSSFVRRKFKMGANAAGSLSINICK